MAHYIIIIIIILDVGLCPLVIFIPLGLLYIPGKSSHLNHVIDLVLLINVMYKEVTPLKWLIYLIFCLF